MGISTSTLEKLAKQEPVTLEILEKICNVLDCNIGNLNIIMTEILEKLYRLRG